MNSSTRLAWIGLGGNVGDVATSMRRAVAGLAHDGEIEIEAVASLYATPPWGRTDQPDFLNSAVRLRTSLNPFDLLERCLATERSLHRERRERWGPRSIDLDVLAMEGVLVDTPRLRIPHPRLRERAFALLPLAELGPHLQIEGKRVADLAATVDRSGIRTVALAGWLDALA